MPNHENGQVVINYDWGVDITLGDGHDDRVEDRSPGSNTISLGDGNHDFVAAPFGGGDTITLGDGEGDAVVEGGRGFNTIIFGDGAHDTFESAVFHPGIPDPTLFFDTVTFGNGAGDAAIATDTYGGNTFIFGNGDGDRVVFVGRPFSHSEHDTVEFGHGAHDYVALNTIAYGVTGLVDVTFGGPAATLDLSAIQGPSFAYVGWLQTFVPTTGLDVISGLVRGDHIVVPGSNVFVGRGQFDGYIHGAVFTVGTYSASAHTFTESVKGLDAVLTFDTTSAVFVSVVLVGAAGEIAGSTIHDGTITLG